MSWIVQDLWKTLEARQDEYAGLIERDSIGAYDVISQIATQAGERWGVFVQLNFPPGQKAPSLQSLAHRDLTILVYRDRHKFSGVSETDVKNAFLSLSPVGFDQVGHDYEGFRVNLPKGRIDCLPGGVHLWCELTPDVLSVLDWLFTHAYNMKHG